MALRMIACSVGIALVAWLPALPSLLLLIFLLVALLLCGWLVDHPHRRNAAALASCLCAGLIVGTIHGKHLLSQLLPPAVEGQDLMLVGVIEGLPTYSPQRGGTWRFTFKVEQWLSPGCCAAQRLRLSYRTGEILQAGQRLQLQVRLKRPRSFANPGGFDYARWLVSQDIHASGYVRQGRVLDIHASLRNRIVQHLNDKLLQYDSGAVLLALAVGERHALTDSQWTLFRQTGLSHLMAISGLHIGIAAGLGFLLGRALSLVAGSPSIGLPVAISLLSALGYAWLAGFSLPTQRAVLMCAVAVLSLPLLRKIGRWSCWSFALLVVLLLQPLASLQPGFWLSFLAVALLLLVFEQEQRWRSVLRAQWLLLVGLMPLGLAFFGFFSPLSLPVNLIAVPFFSLMVVPLVLLSLCGELVFSMAANWGWYLADVVLAHVFTVLQWLVDQLDSWMLDYQPDRAILFTLMVLAVLLVLPQHIPARYLSLLLCLPLLDRWLEPVENPSLRADQVLVQVMDVGQGLSILLTTRHHALVYDVGAAYRGGFNLAEAAVLPTLRAEQIRRLDTLVISHNDNDHAGAYEILRQAFPGVTLYAGETLPGSVPCRAGSRWRWDDVSFEFLHPQRADTGSSNNQSCVLLVRSGDAAVLLPGDIEASVEHQLLPALPDKVSVLVAPHHGSKTSSSEPFTDKLQPEWVVFSAGYKHHFGHPAPDVEQRYISLGSHLLNTAQHGRIRILLGARGVESVSTRRRERRFYWQ